MIVIHHTSHRKIFILLVKHIILLLRFAMLNDFHDLLRSLLPHLQLVNILIHFDPRQNMLSDIRVQPIDIQVIVLA